ncbi:MAG: glycosyltransferase family 2 protein [Thermoplasmata archaeon]
MIVADPIGVAFSAISILITILYVHYVYYAIKGFKKRKSSTHAAPQKRFAILIPARNEQGVIADAVRSAIANDYPRNLYDVFIIVDDSNDPTAQIAEKEGAFVLVRGNSSQPGLGHVLEWAIPKLMEQKKYDAFVVLGADCTISKDYLRRMNNELVAGYKVVQGHLKSKNPKQDWVTKTIHADYTVRNRFFKQARVDNKLCVFIEPGECISADILEKYGGWKFTSVAEDLEFTSQLACDGIGVRWVKDAIVYDEKPNSLGNALRQRKRWMKGHADVLTRYARKLASSAVRNRNTIALDCLLYLLFPLFTLAWFFGLLGFVMSGSRFTLLAILPENLHESWIVALFNIFLAFWWIVIPWLALYLEGENAAEYWFTPITIMLFALAQAFLFAYGMFNRKDKSWWRTPHSFSLSKTETEPAANPIIDPPSK